MSFLGKASLILAALIISLAAVPAAKADPIIIRTTGFSLSNLGNDGTGLSGKDSLVGISTETHNIDTPGDYQVLLNLLAFDTGFTGANSGGPHAFNFSQLVTINGQTQTLNLVGRIDIDHLVDTVHILSSAPLTFNFNTFSVVLTANPVDLAGIGVGSFSGQLTANMIVTTTGSAIPEPATLTLLGLGLAGIAARIRQKRKTRAA
jgi:hypothetical protein